MTERFCKSCNRRTGHHRHFGFGTVLLLLMTSGGWLIAMPAYPLRCHICDTENGITFTGTLIFTICLLVLYSLFFVGVK